MDIYSPREDSYLMVRAVEKYATGKVLDMGTGTGIQAITASQKQDVTEVTGADTNPAAIDHCKKLDRNINWIESDMFSNIEGKFDTIIFNPPYLPDEPGAMDIALDGGPEGFELIERFLLEARSYLNENGKILILFSTLSNPPIILKIIEKLHYSSELAYREKLSFEELYVYILK